MARASYYDKVRPGETLEAFARRNGVPPDAVRSANRLGAGARLASGQMLFVPRERGGSTASARPAPATGSRASTTPPRAQSQSPQRQGTAPRPAAPDPNVYTVRSGDTLIGVARRLGVSVEDLAQANAIKTTAILDIGQRLRIPPRRAVATPAPAAPERPASDPSPAPRTGRGTGGGGSEPADTRVPDVPGGGTAAPRPSRRGFIWPVEGRVIARFVNTDRAKQLGVNIAAPIGTPVLAARDGTVMYASDAIRAYGRMIVIEHDGGLATCYAHNRRLLVKEGQRVRQGQQIAEVGDSGPGVEPALHFEVRRNRAAVDPEEYLP